MARALELPDLSRPLSRVERWLVAATATLVMAVSYVDRQVLAVLGESVTRDLDIDNEAFGWLASAFSIAYLCAAPIAGTLVDRFGARRSLIVAVLVWSAVSALHALASSFAMLFVLRIALGTAEAPSFPGAAQTIRRVLLPAERSAGFGMLFTGSFVGAMIAGPLAIGLKRVLGSWQLAFVGVAALGLLWIPAWLFVTRGKRARAALGAVEAAPPGVPSSRWRLFLEPAVLRAVVLVIGSAPAIMFVLIWFPKFMLKTYGLVEADLAQYIWLPPLFFDAGAVGFGAIASWRERNLAPGAVRGHPDLIGVAAVLAGALALVPLAPSPWIAVLLGGVSMSGGGALFARLTADMLARVNPANVSMAGGLTAAAQSLAYVVANPLVGRAVDATGSYTGALVVIGLLSIPGAMAWIAWPMRNRE